ncbi:MAG: T9SS type A sorting domain-containing protein [Porphyromonadaceae bacterium]|jgi:hypothetical protein|nr:T9SS type A sorting domain-containing protein [Porphyromonadaceae bacterium]
MKNRILFFLISGLMLSTTAWKSAAQSNTTWANAQLITAGEEITSNFTPGTTETLWYKIAITEGNYYEIPYHPSPFYLYMNEGDARWEYAWNDYTYNDSYDGFRAIQFQASQTTTMYIQCSYRESLGSSFSWSIIEVTDNRVCSYAEDIQIGNEIILPKGQKIRWYKAAHQADKYYMASVSGGLLKIKKSCDGQDVATGERIFQVTEAGNYYFRVQIHDFKSEEANNSLKIREIPIQTNTTKEAAYSMQPNERTEFSTVFGRELYFKANLVAGKAYEVIADIEQQFWNIDLEVSDAQGNVISDLKDSQTFAGASKWFVAPTTGLFYFKRTAGQYYNDTQLFAMTLSEINDARFCSNAVAVSQEQTVSYHHKEYKNLWWKIDLEAGSTYLIDLNNNDEQECKLKVFKDCASTQPLAESAKTFSLTTTSAGTYYLEASAYSLQGPTKPSNSFSIRKITNQNNKDCASALQFEPNNQITTAHAHGETLWYKVNVTGGKTYELNGKKAPNDTERVEVYNACQAGLQPIQTGYREALYFTPEANMTYYIKWTGSSQTEAFVWSFNEVTDNRICRLAESITLGEPVVLTPEMNYPNNSYWYKLTLEGGKYYEIDFSKAFYSSSGWFENGDELELYAGCGKERLAGFFKSKQMLAPDKDSVIYIKVSRGITSSVSTLEWTVFERRTGDNRLCSHAEEITLDTEIRTNHLSTKYATQWYKMTLEGGKAYEVAHLYAAHDLFYYMGDEVCATIPEYRDDNRITKGKKTLIYVPETAVYYFLSKAQDVDIVQTDFRWKITESEGDNRMCNFATQVTLGEEFTVNHDEANTRWYKVEVEKNNLYLVDYSSLNHIEYQVEVYEACGLSDYVANGLYVKSFVFKAATTGTYYVKCKYNSGSVSCTISAITDNRSCQYPVEVTAGQTVSGENMTETGLWYTVNLQKDGLYEFDFMNAGSGVYGNLYATCSDESPLARGQREKLLFKATQTGAYLVHLSTEYSVDEAWSWSYSAATASDNRLCEYAVPLAADTTVVNVGNGIRQYWYTMDVQAGKFYQFGCDEGLVLDVYTACGQTRPISSVRSSWTYAAENATKLYLKVSAPDVTDQASWHAVEILPDGRFCTHPLHVQLGQTITSSPRQLGNSHGDLPPSVWYHFIPETTGIYEIESSWQLSTPPSHNLIDYFWAVQVFEDCSLDSLVTQCGHWSRTATTRFKAYANTDYRIAVPIFEQSLLKDHTWKIVKSQTLKGTINVSLAQADGTIMNAQNAKVLLYQRVNDAIICADTLTYSTQGFRSKNLDYGTYLLYAENVGKGSDMKTYLAGWYEKTGIWQEATEIILDSEIKDVEFRLTAAPDDIFAGDVTIAGFVSAIGSEGGQAVAKENIDISIYRKKSGPQGIRPQAVKAIYRVVSADDWELVARLKTDAEGKYRIANLPEGSYMILVDLPGYSAEDSGIVIDASAGENYENNDFQADEETMTIIKVSTGLSDANAYRVKLYPNPFEQEIIVESANDAWLQVFNASGVCVYSQKLTLERETVQLTNLPAGIYYFRIEKDGKSNAFVTIKK